MRGGILGQGGVPLREIVRKETVRNGIRQGMSVASDGRSGPGGASGYCGRDLGGKGRRSS